MDSNAVKELLKNVTPGPWENDGEPWDLIVWDGSGNRVCFMAHSNGLNDAGDVATARFIAAARELVPALLARAEAAEAERDALRGAKWAEKHVDTMNDMVLMGMARDEAVAALAAERETVARLTEAIEFLLSDVDDDMASAIIARAALTQKEPTNGE